MKLTGLVIASIGLVLCIAGVVYINYVAPADTTRDVDVADTSPTSHRENADDTANATSDGDEEADATAANSSPKHAVATFGAGCFWCTEAVFERLEGVTSVESGYSGGETPNPTYEFICTGQSGHAEVVQIEFNPQVISYKELLEVFWKTHNPTTLNRQGNDKGTQYRSVVFYHNEQQKELATKYMKKLGDAEIFSDPIVTEISPYSNFYVAEVSHQDYYRLNGRDSYCQFVVAPKVRKVETVFKDKLKAEYAD